jgi:ankyrin repeat domain-containing protein 50
LEVLVKQTVEKHPSCRAPAEEVYKEHFRLKTRPTEEELLQLLRVFTTMVKASFYFLDALDEAPAPIQFDLLMRLSSLNVKLFITSRPLTILQAEFPDVHCFIIAAQDGDLELHINREIQRSPQLRRLLDKADPSWRLQVVSAVKEKCGGM